MEATEPKQTGTGVHVTDGAGPGADARFERTLQRGLQESAGTAGLLALRQRVQLHTSIRPASDSATVGTSSILADPVSRNRPRRRSRSTACLMAGSSAGTRCTSSNVTMSGRLATKPGASFAAVSW